MEGVVIDVERLSIERDHRDSVDRLVPNPLARVFAHREPPFVGSQRPGTRVTWEEARAPKRRPSSCRLAGRTRRPHRRIVSWLAKVLDGHCAGAQPWHARQAGRTPAMELPPLDYTPTIPGSIRRAAQLFGERDFIVMPDERLSYADADRASRRVARELLATGIGKGTRVAMIDTYSIEWVVFWLAATRIGALFVPMASTMKPPELRWALRHSDVHLLVIPPAILGVDTYDFVEHAVPGLSDSQGAPLFVDRPAVSPRHSHHSTERTRVGRPPPLRRRLDLRRVGRG